MSSDRNVIDLVDLQDVARELREALNSEDACDIDDWAEDYAADLLHTVEHLYRMRRRDERARQTLTLYVKETQAMVVALGDLVLAQEGADTLPVAKMQAVVREHFPKLLGFAWTAEGWLLHDREANVRKHAQNRLRERIQEEAAHAGKAMSTAAAESLVRHAAKRIATPKRSAKKRGRKSKRDGLGGVLKDPVN